MPAGVSYLRVGGTYTDFVEYIVPSAGRGSVGVASCENRTVTVPGAECPGNSFPCCLPLPVDRWAEMLDFAAAVNVKVAFNLNILAGRWPVFARAWKNGRERPATLPSWDPENAKALMQWTASHVPRERWPAAWGLGNELQWFFTPQQYAHDLAALAVVVADVFPTDYRPLIFAPDDANSAALSFGGPLLAEIAARGQSIGAFTFHGYQHSGSDVDAEAAALRDGRAGLDASGQYYAQVAQMFRSATANASVPPQLWITETAWSASAPPNASKGGGAAAVDSMLRAVDMPWFAVALGDAARSGVDVFCRETLAGDWLETLGLWQQGSGSVQYAPHPDFYVAAAWRALMGRVVLNVTWSVALQDDKRWRQPWPALAAPWLLEHNASNVYQSCGLNGSANTPLLGLFPTVTECEEACQASTRCASFTWVDGTVGGGWARRCFGRVDDVWDPTAVKGVTSGCNRGRAPCVSPPKIRVHAHCPAGPTGTKVRRRVRGPLRPRRAVQSCFWLMQRTTPASCGPCVLCGVCPRD